MNKIITLVCIAFFSLPTWVSASEDGMNNTLDTLKNYRINSEKMISAGLPSPQQFALLRQAGVQHVVDLIPGDRSEERQLMASLELDYHNIPVDWEHPKLTDFKQYVATMNANLNQEGKTLTHCKLNWRGAVFTYLYQVTQLGIDETLARETLEAIWQPNETWQAFIDDVKAHYNY